MRAICGTSQLASPHQSLLLALLPAASCAWQHSAVVVVQKAEHTCKPSAQERTLHSDTPESPEACFEVCCITRDLLQDTGFAHAKFHKLGGIILCPLTSCEGGVGAVGGCCTSCGSFAPPSLCMLRLWTAASHRPCSLHLYTCAQALEATT